VGAAAAANVNAAECRSSRPHRHGRRRAELLCNKEKQLPSLLCAVIFLVREFGADSTKMFAIDSTFCMTLRDEMTFAFVDR
jgi:hypothetical protein